MGSADAADGEQTWRCKACGKRQRDSDPLLGPRNQYGTERECDDG